MLLTCTLPADICAHMHVPHMHQGIYYTTMHAYPTLQFHSQFLQAERTHTYMHYRTHLRVYRGNPSIPSGVYNSLSN